MIIKEAQYKECKNCKSRKRVTEEVYGCDVCKTEIDIAECNCLEVQVFSRVEHTKHYHFCSWKCVHKFLPTIKTDYFVSLPYILYDNKRSVKEFLRVFYGK